MVFASGEAEWIQVETAVSCFKLRYLFTCLEMEENCEEAWAIRCRGLVYARRSLDYETEVVNIRPQLSVWEQQINPLKIKIYVNI
jgi:hypothetical protein